AEGTTASGASAARCGRVGGALVPRRVAAGPAALAVAAPARGDVLKDALSRLQHRYDDTRTMQADFRQIVESKTMAGTLETKGKVSFEKPNRMRWDYDPPDPQTIVGDGETLWI